MDFLKYLPLVNRPSRYIGTEVNARKKTWNDGRLRAALIFPDLYEIGMSHLGLHILYHVLNDLPWALADRAYCPDTDMEKLLRSKGIPLWGLESRRPLLDFDLLAITLPYELCYANILTILDLAGIPVWASERHNGHWPVILGGGSCSVNPEPVADFFDAILIGDGEEAICEIAEAIRNWQEAKGTKDELLKCLAGIKGLYVPSFYEPVYTASGYFKAMETQPDVPPVVNRRILSDLAGIAFPTRPLVPFTQIVHDRFGVEIARGCTRGCRFCQASSIYRPVRERPLDQVLSIIDRGVFASGWEELSLLSLSTGDYSCLATLVPELMGRYVEKNISLSLPSLRVGTLTPQIMEQIKKVRKTGFTLAPEAGSERLRRVINKGITERALLETAREAFFHGWNHIKLYFMIGLPTETHDDVQEIAELAKKVLATSNKKGRGRKGGHQVIVSVGTFVPKPHTPFQWERQITPEESWRRIELIKSRLNGKGFRVKWHDPRQSYMEGIFSRGDRRLSRVIFHAWKKGARLDAWSDMLKPDLYMEALRETGLHPSYFLNERALDAPLPWEHISVGIKPEYLLAERKKALKEIYTPDCRFGKCQGCGVCDFKRIQPRLSKPCDDIFEDKRAKLQADNPSKAGQFFYSFTYSKLGVARFLGHLELVHAFHRAARRACLPIAYSAGFNPRPKFSFDQPVPLGLESIEENGGFALMADRSPDHILTVLNTHLPDGIVIRQVKRLPYKPRFKGPETSTYLAVMDGSWLESVIDSLRKLESGDSMPVSFPKKGRLHTLDLNRALDMVRILRSIEKDFDGILPLWLDTDELESVRKGSCFMLLFRCINDVVSGLRPWDIVGFLAGLERPRVKMIRILKLKGLPLEGTVSSHWKGLARSSCGS